MNVVGEAKENLDENHLRINREALPERKNQWRKPGKKGKPKNERKKIPKGDKKTRKEGKKTRKGEKKEKKGGEKPRRGGKKKQRGKKKQQRGVKKQRRGGKKHQKGGKKPQRGGKKQQRGRKKQQRGGKKLSKGRKENDMNKLKIIRKYQKQTGRKEKEQRSINYETCAEFFVEYSRVNERRATAVDKQVKRINRFKVVLDMKKDKKGNFKGTCNSAVCPWRQRFSTRLYRNTNK